MYSWCILRHWFLMNLLLWNCNRYYLFGFSNFNFLSSCLFNLFLLDDFLFLNFVLPFFFLSLTHFNNSLHNLFFLLIYLLFLFLFFPQRHFHRLFHQFFFSSLFSFNHFLCNFDLLWLLCWSCLCWTLTSNLSLLWSRLLLLSLTSQHLDSLLIQLCITLNH